MQAKDARTEPPELDDINRSIISELTCGTAGVRPAGVKERPHLPGTRLPRISRLAADGVLSRFDEQLLAFRRDWLQRSDIHQ